VGVAFVDICTPSSQLPRRRHDDLFLLRNWRPTKVGRICFSIFLDRVCVNIFGERAMSKLQAVRVLSVGAAGMIFGIAVTPESVLAQAITTTSRGGSAQVADPGVRGGSPGAGAPLPGLSQNELSFFNAAKNIFTEVESVSSGLGPRFNLDSCSGCHAQPSVGGSSPPTNPQVKAATTQGAQNTIPPFITASGPVREARFGENPDGSPDGGGPIAPAPHPRGSGKARPRYPLRKAPRTTAASSGPAIAVVARPRGGVAMQYHANAIATHTAAINPHRLVRMTRQPPQSERR
jgi:hypothetical protein